MFEIACFGFFLCLDAAARCRTAVCRNGRRDIRATVLWVRLLIGRAACGVEAHFLSRRGKKSHNVRRPGGGVATMLETTALEEPAMVWQFPESVAEGRWRHKANCGRGVDW